MPEWEITVTTVRCPAVEDEVTILINGDSTATCTGHSGKSRKRPAACQGSCALITETVARFTA